MRTLRLPIWVLETKLQRCRLRPRQPNSRDGFVKLAQALPFLYAAAIAGVVWLCAPEVSEARAWHALRQMTNTTDRYQRQYTKAWKIVRDNYWDRSRLNDWDRWQHAYDGRLHSRAEVKSAIREMLASLHDDYTYLLGDDDMAARERECHEHSCVTANMIAKNIGYIQIANLKADDVAMEFKRAMKRLSNASVFILDLRDNHGGFIDIADSLFAMLAERGTFFLYQGRHDGAPDDVQRALTDDGWKVARNGKVAKQKRLPDLSGGKPIIVLVNQDTRSAAELLAGALRDNKRATLVGTRTFGKGVLQDSYEIADGVEMKVVTAGYFLPAGDSINNRGLVPDVVIDDSGVTGEDLQLRKALAIAEETVRQTASRQSAVAAAGDDKSHM